MDSKIKRDKESDEDRIEFLDAIVTLTRAQLAVGQRIVGIIQHFQNHKTAPSQVGYSATTTIKKMDELDIKACKDYIEVCEKELATLRAKRTVEISFNKKDEEKKEDNKTQK